MNVAWTRLHFGTRKPTVFGWAILLTACWGAWGTISRSASGDWPSFLNGGDQSFDEVSLPTSWKPGENLRWRADLDGYGQSSPVVIGDQIYVTATAGPMKDDVLVSAIGLTDGKVRWTHKAASPSPIKNSVYVSRAAPTPVADETGVVAFFEGGLVVALNPAGEVVWERNLVEAHGPIVSEFGLAASPVLHDGRVIVWVERATDPYVVALDRKTGTEVWKAPGVGKTSWNSPALIPVGDATHLVLSGNGLVVGLDPNDGTKLWTLSDVSGNTTPRPMPAGNGRFVLGASAGRDASDTVTSLVPATNGLYEITSEDGGFAIRRLWGSKRSGCSFNSPLVHAGQVVFINSQGIVFAHDLDTGEELYAERTGPGNWATPLGVGDRIYLFGKDGTTTVLKTGPKYEVLATNTTWGEDDPAKTPADLVQETEPGRARSAAMFSQPVLYAGVVAGDTLLLRRGNVLYAVGSQTR